MHTTMHVQKGKRVGRQVTTARSLAAYTLRIKHQATRYLIDTGSDVSVYPLQRHRMCKGKAEPYQLYAANDSVIPTYGTMTLQPNLGLKRKFP